MHCTINPSARCSFTNMEKKYWVSWACKSVPYPARQHFQQSQDPSRDIQAHHWPHYIPWNGFMLLTNSFCIHKKIAEKMDLFYFQLVIHFCQLKCRKLCFIQLCLRNMHLVAAIKYIPKMITKQNSPQTSNANIWQNMSWGFNLNLLQWNIFRVNCIR